MQIYLQMAGNKTAIAKEFQESNKMERREEQK
jgi:hypothetical protein